MRDGSELVLPGYPPLTLSSYESVPTRYAQSLVTAATPRRIEEVAKKVELERSLAIDRETTSRTPQLLGSDSERFSSSQNTKSGLNEPSKQSVQAVRTDPPPTTVCACLWSRSLLTSLKRSVIIFYSLLFSSVQPTLATAHVCKSAIIESQIGYILS